MYHSWRNIREPGYAGHCVSAQRKPGSHMLHLANTDFSVLWLPASLANQQTSTWNLPLSESGRGGFRLTFVGWPTRRVFSISAPQLGCCLGALVRATPSKIRSMFCTHQASSLSKYFFTQTFLCANCLFVKQLFLATGHQW